MLRETRQKAFEFIILGTLCLALSSACSFEIDVALPGPSENQSSSSSEEDKEKKKEGEDSSVDAQMIMDATAPEFSSSFRDAGEKSFGNSY